MLRSSVGFALALAGIAGAARADSGGAAVNGDTSVPAAAPPSVAAPPADVDADTANNMRSTGATRRSGFTMGIMPAFSVGDASGYPNDFAKLDDPAWHASTTGVGSDVTVYMGGALTDWFTFSFGIAASKFGSSRLESSSTAFVFHIETFPLFARGGVYRDLGIFADVGTGTATLKRKQDGIELSSSGGLSMGGVGAVWEAWRLGGHLAFGPFAAWHYQSSDAMTRQFSELGLRGVFYGGP